MKSQYFWELQSVAFNRNIECLNITQYNPTHDDDIRDQTCVKSRPSILPKINKKAAHHPYGPYE